MSDQTPEYLTITIGFGIAAEVFTHVKQSTTSWKDGVLHFTDAVGTEHYMHPYSAGSIAITDEPEK